VFGYYGEVNLYIEILPVPAPLCAYTCPTAIGSVSFYYEGWWSGPAALILPDNARAGHYDVGVLVFEGEVFTLDATAGITVTGQRPVPETPSMLALLLPAFLLGIYVLRRKKIVNIGNQRTDSET
jgi:hypothetical protein